MSCVNYKVVRENHEVQLVFPINALGNFNVVQKLQFKVD